MYSIGEFSKVEGKMRQYRNIAVSLDHVISTEKEAKIAMQESTFEVQEKVLEPMLIAGFRMKGKYSDCGKGFARIGRAFGRQICGPVFNLYYDGEYREDDADLEACAPIRKGKEVEGISVRELAGGRCVALLHQGPWGQLGRSLRQDPRLRQREGLPDRPADPGSLSQRPRNDLQRKSQEVPHGNPNADRDAC